MIGDLRYFTRTVLISFWEISEDLLSYSIYVFEEGKAGWFFLNDKEYLDLISRKYSAQVTEVYNYFIIYGALNILGKL